MMHKFHKVVNLQKMHHQVNKNQVQIKMIVLKNNKLEEMTIAQWDLSKVMVNRGVRKES